MRPDPPAARLVDVAEHLRDLIDPLSAWRSAAGGGPQVDMPEACGDLVDRNPGLEQVCPYVLSAWGWVSRAGTPRRPDRRMSRCTVTAESARGFSSSYRPNRTNSGCSSSSPTPRARGWTLSHASSAYWTGHGHQDFSFATAFAASSGGDDERYCGDGGDRARRRLLKCATSTRFPRESSGRIQPVEAVSGQPARRLHEVKRSRAAGVADSGSVRRRPSRPRGRLPVQPGRWHESWKHVD